MCECVCECVCVFTISEYMCNFLICRKCHIILCRMCSPTLRASRDRLFLFSAANVGDNVVCVCVCVCVCARVCVCMFTLENPCIIYQLLRIFYHAHTHEQTHTLTLEIFVFEGMGFDAAAPAEPQVHICLYR